MIVVRKTISRRTCTEGTMAEYHGISYTILYGKLFTMNGTIQIDKAGRLVLPKPLREELQVSAGDSFEFEFSGDAVVLRPARPNRRIYKKKGIWVLNTGESMSAEVPTKTLHQVRKEREDRFLGKSR